MDDSRKSSRKALLKGARIRFGQEIGEYSEVEEDEKIVKNRNKY